MHYRPTVAIVRAGLGSSSLAAAAAATLLVLTAALLADIVRYQVENWQILGCWHGGVQLEDDYAESGFYLLKLLLSAQLVAAGAELCIRYRFIKSFLFLLKFWLK